MSQISQNDKRDETLIVGAKLTALIILLMENEWEDDRNMFYYESTDPNFDILPWDVDLLEDEKTPYQLWREQMKAKYWEYELPRMLVEDDSKHFDDDRDLSYSYYVDGRVVCRRSFPKEMCRKLFD